MMTHTKGMCVDLSPGVGQSTDLISLVSCNPIRLVKDEEILDSIIDGGFPIDDQLLTATIIVCDRSRWYWKKLFDPHCSWLSDPLSRQIC